MTEFKVPYGKEELSFTLPNRFEADLLSPKTGKPLDNPEEALRHALKNPIGVPKRRAADDVQTIGIAINDKTRPVPNPNPLNILLDHFDQLGFRKDQITLFVGSGTHQPMSESELTRIMQQDIVDQYRIVIHDCDHSPLTELGHTPHGTRIKINADFMACDLKITLGNIEPHHFMGYSGGVKTAVIGLAGRETINTNHAMLTHPQAKSGVYHINPMRQDIEIMGRKAGINFSLGTILDEKKQILKFYFGEPGTVMKAAIPAVQGAFGVRVPEPYDLVIASPGGAPKDVNLYQAEKGLTHAARITRQGGWLILLAACPEGSGSAAYEEYIQAAESHQAVINQFDNGFFEIGPHKAFQIARKAVQINLILVSEIHPRAVKGWKLTPSTSELLQPLIDWIAARLPTEARAAVLPAATRTMTEIAHE
jgi:lactate racemase